MRGVVLAGGKGSRLGDFTKYIANKHMALVYDRPMISYPLETLAKAGIKDVSVVAGGSHLGPFLSYLENGRAWGFDHLEVIYQKNEGGIAEALALTERFANGSSIACILGDNLSNLDISESVKIFSSGAHLFIKKVSDPQRYGVPIFDNNGSILKIEEKPQKPGSSYAITGLYLYDHGVYDYAKQIKPSARNELEITDINNLYIKNDLVTYYDIKDSFWMDAGTYDSLYQANKYYAEKAVRDKETEDLYHQILEGDHLGG